MFSNEQLSIAIDGGAGTGSSTAAEGVAERLSKELLNSGGHYRALAFMANLLPDFSPYDEVKVTRLAQNLKFEIENGEVVSVGVTGQIPVRDRLKTDEIDEIVPIVSAYGGVRGRMVRLQCEYANGRCVVMEGRDIGTEVLPGALVKIYLTCELNERVRRLRAAGKGTNTLKLAARDKRDSERLIGPLRQADGAVPIDTTNLSPDEVADRIAKTYFKVIGVNVAKLLLAGRSSESVRWKELDPEIRSVAVRYLEQTADAEFEFSRDDIDRALALLPQLT